MNVGFLKRIKKISGKSTLSKVKFSACQFPDFFIGHALWDSF